MRKDCGRVADSIGRARLTGFAELAGLASCLALTVAVGIPVAHADAPIDTLFDQMKQQAKGNPYLEDRIHDVLHELAKELKEERLQTQLRNTTPLELLRGIERTEKGDHILAVDYGIDWEGMDFTPYLGANLEAAGRGVKITRIFIVAGKAPKRGLCHVMSRMQQAGITVLVASKDDLTGRREYEESKAARVIFHYRNKYAVLMIETTPLPDLRLGDPYLLDVTWSMPKVSESIKYVDWLMDKKRSVPFTPAICK
ncbi:MAG: hypothetical protein AB1411_01615 [Nitrospirota bacterium]